MSRAAPTSPRATVRLQHPGLRHVHPRHHGAGNSVTIGILAAGLAAALGRSRAARRVQARDRPILSRLSEIVFAFPMILGAIVILTAAGTRSVLLVSVTLAVLTWCR